MRVEIVPPEERKPALPHMEAHKFDPNTGEDELAEQMPRCPHAAADRASQESGGWGKVGRNESLPPGSGKKYKHCHGPRCVSGARRR